MTNTWLLLDVNYLCWRAHYATGHLSHGGEPTGMLFGFFQSLLELQERFGTRKIAFCFDRGKGKRRELCPTYKANRGEITEESKAVIQQIGELRRKHLPGLGYRNVLSQTGFEADDVIASVAKWSLGPQDTGVIVSADADLWQLVRRGVVWFNPHTKTLVNREAFIKQWRICPEQWAHVKALAGCPGDNVIGVHGVGEVTAARYYAGTLKRDSKLHERIEANLNVHNANLPLVRLPFPGTKTFNLYDDYMPPKAWDEFCDGLGLETLKAGKRKRRKR